MALIVQKYGGTSMGSVERIETVADRIVRARQAGHDVVVTVSAMSGETNRLIALAQRFAAQPSPRELDVLMSSGEQVSMALLAIALEKRGCPALSLAGWQVGIFTDSQHTKARIQHIDDGAIYRALSAGKVVIVAGFQGVDEAGDITTLGRGGSDTTAVALAAVLKADECQIYTDVDGVYTTDPRIEPRARKLEQISFVEMLEMASLGSKVLQIRSVEFAGKYHVPVRVLSSFSDDETGTLISSVEGAIIEATHVTGIAFTRNEVMIQLMHLPDDMNTLYQILRPIGCADISLDMVAQTRNDDGSINFSFIVPHQEKDRVIGFIVEQFSHIAALSVLQTEIAKISLVGLGLRSHTGIIGRILQALMQENIPVHCFATSETRVSLVTDLLYLERAVHCLHDAFQLEKADECRESF